MTRLVEIRGDVVRVVRGGFEDFAEGGDVRRDQAVVEVTQPSDLAGRVVRIVIDDDAAADVLDREGPVAFDVDPSDLELEVVFSGALENLRRLGEDV